jgi:hypothetical protein
MEARSTFKLACGRGDEAAEAVQEYFSETEDYSKGYSMDHHHSIAHTKMCELMYLKQNAEKLLFYGQQGEKLFGKRSHQVDYLGITLAAQALALRWLDRANEATTAYQRATRCAAAFQGPMHYSYYNMVADYHVAGGETDAAISLRDKQLGEIAGKGQPYREATVRLYRARLLKRRGDSIDAEVDTIRKLAAALRKPAIITDALDALLAG